MEMREALQEKEQEKSLKSKMREKVRPKLGKIDIDYQNMNMRRRGLPPIKRWETRGRQYV